MSSSYTRLNRLITSLPPPHSSTSSTASQRSLSSSSPNQARPLNYYPSHHRLPVPRHRTRSSLDSPSGSQASTSTSTYTSSTISNGINSTPPLFVIPLTSTPSSSSSSSSSKTTTIKTSFNPIPPPKHLSPLSPRRKLWVDEQSQQVQSLRSLNAQKQQARVQVKVGSQQPTMNSSPNSSSSKKVDAGKVGVLPTARGVSVVEARLGVVRPQKAVGVVPTSTSTSTATSTSTSTSTSSPMKSTPISATTQINPVPTPSSSRLSQIQTSYFTPEVLSSLRNTSASSTTGTQAGEDLVGEGAVALGKSSLEGEQGTALVFAGLGSYPHLPTHPSSSSLKIWQRASSALLTPCESMGYSLSGLEDIIENSSLHESSATHGGDDGTWLRNWITGKSLNELMERPGLVASFVLSGNVALLASAQEATGSPSLLPHSTSHVLGHGFVGILTCLVVTGKVALEDAVKLCRIYCDLPASPELDHRPGGLTRTSIGLAEDHPNGSDFMTTLLTISSNPSLTRLHSLSEPHSYHHPSSSSSSSRSSSSSSTQTPFSVSSAAEKASRAPLERVLQIIHEMQESEGWNHNLMRDFERHSDGTLPPYSTTVSKPSAQARAEVREWAGEAMINSDSKIVISGTKGAVIKIIDRVRATGLATPVMDLLMPAPFHTPLMRHAVHQFREHLQGCKFYPDGGAPPAGWLVKGVEPEVQILDGMTCQPINLSDIPSALVAYLTRPLQWGQTTRSLWSTSSITSNTPTPTTPSSVTQIRTVGKGAKGLGMMVEKELRFDEVVSKVRSRESSSRKRRALGMEGLWSASAGAGGAKKVGKGKHVEVSEFGVTG